MLRPVLKQTVLFLNFSAYRGQPGRDVWLHRYFTFFKLNQWLVLLGRHTKNKGIKMFGSENVLEPNICMYADDTQLFKRNEESVEQTFKVLVKYEKASGSKINYEKTKGLFIGRLIGKLPKFAKISWVTDNIKALGVFHSYDINTDTV
jgi:hypothetical protein